MCIDDLIDSYKELSIQIKEWSAKKDEIEAHILSLLPYNKDGQKTLNTLRHKVCIKSGYYFKVIGDSDALESPGIPDEFNPFKSAIKWDLDKKKYEMLSAYPQYKEVVDALIEKVQKSAKVEVL